MLAKFSVKKPYTVIVGIILVIALGVISYVVIHAVTGRENCRKISPAMYVLAVLFVLKYVLI